MVKNRTLLTLTNHPPTLNTAAARPISLPTSASISLPPLKFGQLQQAATYFESGDRSPTHTHQHTRLSTNPHHLHVSDIRQTSTSSTVRMLYVKNTRQQSATATLDNNNSFQQQQQTTRTTQMESAGDSQVAYFNKQLDLRLGLKGGRQRSGHVTTATVVATKPPTVISGKQLSSATTCTPSSASKKSPAPVVSQQRLRRTLSLSATGKRSQKSPSSPSPSHSKSQRILMDQQKYKRLEYVRASTDSNGSSSNGGERSAETHITAASDQHLTQRVSRSQLVKGRRSTTTTKLPMLIVEDTSQLQEEMGSLNIDAVPSSRIPSIQTIPYGRRELLPRQSVISSSPTSTIRSNEEVISDCSSMGSARRDDDIASIGSRLDDFVDENGEGGLGDDFYDDDMIGSIDDDYDDEDEDDDSGSGSNTTVSMSTSLLDMDREPALTISLFHNCPAVINFVAAGHEVERLPREIRNKLRWKFGTTMPIVVKKTITRSGFKRAKKKDDWIGYYGKHMKSGAFKQIKLHQKVNHIPGSFQMGRKDRLWKNFHRCAIRYGKKEFSFLPQTYCLPHDRKILRSNWDESKRKEKYILKPPASARGIGIKVISKWNQIPTKKPCIVQKYLAKPLLINESKFDIRLYVYVSSFDPLRAYLYEDGLARFATHKYSSAMSDLGNKYMHLTNYSINKNSGLFQQNDDVTQCVGHKWSLMALMQYLRDHGHNTSKLYDQIKDIIVKTLISIEHWTNREIKINCRKPQICHEVFGFDVMLDSNLRPWILEVNISPSLHSNSELDAEIKGGMVKDMFNIAGFQIPSTSRRRSTTSVVPSASSTQVNTNRIADTFHNYTLGLTLTDKPSFHKDRKKILSQVSYAAKSKQNYFSIHYKSWTQDEVQSFMLGKLTVNDIRVLCESEDEHSRRGRFQRVFPTPPKKYLRFFDQIRYFNVLLHCWEVKYANSRDKGIRLLQSLCRKNMNKFVPKEEEAKGIPVNWSSYVNRQQQSAVRSIRSTTDARRSPSSRALTSSSSISSRRSPATSSKSSPGISYLVPSRHDFNANRLAPIAAEQQRPKPSSETPTTAR